MPPVVSAQRSAAATARIDLLILGTDAADTEPWLAALAAEGLSVDTLAPARAAVRALLLVTPGALGPALPQVRDLRQAWPQSPLLVLCPAPRDVDQVLALEMGADEVLAIGTAPVVLAARLRALWRWQQRQGDAAPAGDGAARRLRFGSLAIDREQRSVTLANQTVPLTEGEFEVLWLLASHSGEPLSRREMLQRLRGIDPALGAASNDLDGDRSIDSRVYRLRGKLGDRSRAAPGIRTVRHRGYLFAPAVW